MNNRIALAGCGNVGTALLEILQEKRSELAGKYGFKFEVVLICDLMKGTIMDPQGLDLDKVLDAIHNKRGFMNFPPVRGTFEDLLDASRATVMAEATPTNLKTGEPGMTHIKAALSRGINVTTTNKGPISLALDELEKLAADCGARLRFEGTVMSGTPFISMIRTGMVGCQVKKIEGILNGTTNFMLTKMGGGLSYAQALEEAQARGYAEADPTGDVEGWDAAVKVSIMAKIFFGRELPVAAVDRTGITELTPEKVRDAAAAGCKVKLLAGLEEGPHGFSAYVAPRNVPFSNPLSSIDGATNAVTITTDNLGPVTIIGPGAGRRETGQALLEDIYAFCREKKSSQME